MKYQIIAAVCLIVCLTHSNAQRTPSISYISQEQIKDIGGERYTIKRQEFKALIQLLTAYRNCGARLQRSICQRVHGRLD